MEKRTRDQLTLTGIGLPGPHPGVRNGRELKGEHLQALTHVGHLELPLMRGGGQGWVSLYPYCLLCAPWGVSPRDEGVAYQ